MHIDDFVWLPDIIEKLASKHQVTEDEIADSWDTHSLADSWDQTQEVEFEVGAKRRRRADAAVAGSAGADLLPPAVAR